jgi:predicted nucleotidyltransferase
MLCMETEDILSKIKIFFKDLENIHTVIVYGSLVERKFNRYSDIDIAIASHKTVEYPELLKINADLQILLHRNIDLVDLDKSKGLIHYKIISKGMRLKYSSKNLTEHMIRAMDFKTDLLPQIQILQKKRIERTAYGS